MRIKLPAKGGTGGAGGNECSTTVLGKAAEAQPGRVGAEGGLRPLFVVGQKARELFEATADRSVERTQSFFVVAGRDHSGREDHFAEASTVSQKPESDLRVRKLAQSLQETASLGDPFLRVLVAESRVPDGPPQKLEISVPNNFEIVRKGGDVDSGVNPSSKDKLAFVLVLRRAGAEGEADSVGLSTHGRDGSGYRL